MSKSASTPIPGKPLIAMPDAYLLIFFVVVLAAAATYFIPAGQFDVVEKTVTTASGEQTRRLLDPDTFRVATDPETGSALYQRVGLFSGNASERMGLFNYAFEGITSGGRMGAAVGVIAFILIIGGAFGIILRTGAVEAGILAVIGKVKGSERLLLPVLFLLFSLGGAIFGMSEEAIAFAMIIVPLTIALGYDSITGVLVTYVATQIGFAASWMNPFNVGVAQGLAGVPVMSGSGFRIVLWLCFTLVTLAFVLWYAARIKQNPASSPTFKSDDHFRQEVRTEELAAPLVIGHKLVLLVFALGLFWVIYGVVVHEYYIPEIATQFFVMGVVCGIIGAAFKLNDMSFNDIASSFRKGAGDLLGAALIVGMAKGIVLMLGGDQPGSPSVLNTLLHAAGTTLQPLHDGLAAWSMFVVQACINFFVPSGSGQAALTMPLMAPLSDIV
ncbi:MAG: putative basic amino acid antiporter YfcC, partial [Verrucomicrobia bacterium]|nr:putative basic amino acid antiporter YfcC [Verrucomicrobiota bacterium]